MLLFCHKRLFMFCIPSTTNMLFVSDLVALQTNLTGQQYCHLAFKRHCIALKNRNTPRGIGG
jgi:hypothetical protein